MSIYISDDEFMATESFIGFCDELMGGGIVTESGKEIQDTFIEEMIKISEMKKQMNSIQNNPKKCLRMCEEIRTMLTSLKSKIQSMDYSLKDKALKLSPLISAIGGVILAAAGRASGNDAVNYASIGASVGSMGLGAAIRTYRKDLYSKEAALKIIDTELRCCDECIKDLRG